jgi:hypothetical protein
MAGTLLDRLDDANGSDDRLLPHCRPRMKRPLSDVLVAG